MIDVKITTNGVFFYHLTVANQNQLKDIVAIKQYIK